MQDVGVMGERLSKAFTRSEAIRKLLLAAERDYKDPNLPIALKKATWQGINGLRIYLKAAEQEGNMVLGDLCQMFSDAAKEELRQEQAESSLREITALPREIVKKSRRRRL